MKDKLTDYLTYDKPFGPEDASLVTDPYCRSQLFQNENAIYNRLIQNPSLVLGRKGSGKTAFLHSGHRIRDYQIRLELNSPSAFATLLRLIDKIVSKGGRVISPEPIAKIWSICFWWALLSGALTETWSASQGERQLSGQLRKDLTTYNTALFKRKRPTLAQFIVDSLSAYEEWASAEGTALEDLPDFIYRHPVAGFELESLLKRVSDEMENCRLKALLIIDSLDPHADGKDRFDVQKGEGDLAIKGILKALGEFSRGNKVYHVRFALPSERHSQFLELSTNPAKDMVSIAVLRWTGSDLACIAAHRLNLFYREHAEFNAHYNTRYSKLDTKRRKEAVGLLQLVLGKTIQNRLGVDESPISYVMRHTQLLPRHVLLYLNSIFALAKQSGESLESISGKAIREGITSVEQTICFEVFAAYRHLYPAANKLCEACLPELTCKFAIGDLQSVFWRHGKKVEGSDDFDAFKRMLIEMGVIGRFERTTDLYHVAEFEYSSPHQLRISSSDFGCIHPAFSEIYNTKQLDDFKVVYPHGSDAEEE